MSFLVLLVLLLSSLCIAVAWFLLKGGARASFGTGGGSTWLAIFPIASCVVSATCLLLLYTSLRNGRWFFLNRYTERVNRVLSSYSLKIEQAETAQLAFKEGLATANYNFHLYRLEAVIRRDAQLEAAKKQPKRHQA